MAKTTTEKTDTSRPRARVQETEDDLKTRPRIARHTRDYDLEELLLATPDLMSGELFKKRILRSVDAAPRFSFPLPKKEDLPGSGIYLLYYSGNSALLQGCQSTVQPIYVGSAHSKARLMGSKVGTRKLWARLRDHEDSIMHATGLEIKDFTWSVVPMDDLFCTAAELMLLSFFDSVWNGCFSGFGALSGRESTFFDAIHDRPGNKMGKLRDVTGFLATLYVTALEKLDTALLRHVQRAKFLESHRTLLDAYLDERSTMREQEKLAEAKRSSRRAAAHR